MRTKSHEALLFNVEENAQSQLLLRVSFSLGSVL